MKPEELNAMVEKGRAAKRLIDMLAEANEELVNIEAAGIASDCRITIPGTECEVDVQLSERLKTILLEIVNEKRSMIMGHIETL